MKKQVRNGLSGLLGILFLVSCGSGQSVASYDGVKLPVGTVESASEKKAVANLYNAAMDKESQMEEGNGSSSSSVKKANTESADDADAENASASSSAEEEKLPFDSYRAEYVFHYEMTGTFANGSSKASRSEDTSVVWTAVYKPSFLFELEEKHTTSASLPGTGGTYSGTQNVKLHLEDNDLYGESNVSGNYFKVGGKFHFALPSFTSLYDGLNGYLDLKKASEDLRFEAGGDENDNALKGILDDGKAEILASSRDGVEVQFDYASRGTYSLTFDPETSLLTKAELDLSRAYRANEKKEQPLINDVNVIVSVSLSFTYGNQTIQKLTDEEKKAYSTLD